MKWRHWFLVVVFAVLQGMAPLLHAHLGGDRGGATGVHLHGAASHTHGDVAALGVPHVTPDESPAIGVGQELRRKWSWVMPDLAPLPVMPAPAVVAAPRGADLPRLVPAIVGAPARLTPPAQGPPRRA